MVVVALIGAAVADGGGVRRDILSYGTSVKLVAMCVQSLYGFRLGHP